MKKFKHDFFRHRL